jgi:CubicO group peptidase (beta-lactamase class C family)
MDDLNRAGGTSPGPGADPGNAIRTLALSLVLVLALVVLPAAAGTTERDTQAKAAPFDAETLAAFGDRMETLREALRIPAISVAIVHHGELVWSKGFGTANLEKAIEATADTPYGLASVTKPFAVFLLMRAVEDGRLDLDAPIADFGLDLGDPSITVRHLLSHTSEGTPGNHYVYNGSRYSRLTSIIEQLYGESFRSVLRREILTPLGMDNTALNQGSACGCDYYLSTLSPEDPERAFDHVYRDAAIPYQYAPDYSVYPVPVPTYANAAAGLISTVSDLATFAAAIQRDALVRAETKELMFTPTVLNSGASGPYGLGWFTEPHGETRLIWHYGYGAYSSLFLMLPDNGLTFIVLANSQNLSRPFGLGSADVSVLRSPFALAFYKTFVLQPRLDAPLPSIDWTADEDPLVEQLAQITDPPLRALYEGELWTTRMTAAGAGRWDMGSKLLAVHREAFPDFPPSARDLYQVGRPGARPAEPSRIRLADEEAARWVGTYRLQPAYLESGLPVEVEIRWNGEQLLAIDPASGCQELYAQTPVRLVTSMNTDIILVAAEGGEPLSEFGVEYGGQPVGVYERTDEPAPL